MAFDLKRWKNGPHTMARLIACGGKPVAAPPPVGRMIVECEVEPMTPEQFAAEIHAPECACIRCERTKNNR